MRMYSLCLSFIFAVLVSGIAFADEDPVTFYDSYLKVSANANSLEELKPYISEKNLKEMGEVPDEDEALFLEFMQETRASMKRKNISSKVEGNKATLTIEAVSIEDNTPIDGTVILVKEKGTWKVESEDFTSNVVIE